MRDTSIRWLQQECFMILLLDLGNTNLYVGIDQNGTLISEYRTDSDLTRSSDMYRSLLKEFLNQNNLKADDFEGAILSSVIPSLSRSIVHAVETLIGKKCLLVSNKLKSGLSIHIDNPSELGADLVCDCVGAIGNYPLPCFITDLGTANKFLIVDNKKNFIGGIITPGIKLSMQSLIRNAAQLSDLSYQKPEKIVGKNTLDCLNSGAIYGTSAMIKELLRETEKELNCQLYPILTGGNSYLIKDELSSFKYDPHLIFKGLKAIYEKNRGLL